YRYHRSGENIDKINRASNSLGVFFDESFMLSYMIFRLFGAAIALFAFMPFAGIAALSFAGMAFAVIFIFDRYLFKQYLTLNKFGNHVASAVHDYVSNIESVITLRLEDRTVTEVTRRI